MSDIFKHIKFDEKALGETVSAAVLTLIDQQARDNLIKDAIAYLMTPKKDTYGYKQETPLQDAFRSAVQTSADKIVTDLVQNDETIKAAIKSIITEVILKTFEGEAKVKLVSALSIAVSDAFTIKERNY